MGGFGPDFTSELKIVNIKSFQWSLYFVSKTISDLDGRLSWLANVRKSPRILLKLRVDHLDANVMASAIL